MKVTATQTRFSADQKALLHVDVRIDPEWQITIGNDYVVISVACIPDSVSYGKAVLYRVVDDFDRLILVPACLFIISDPRPSRFWQATYDGNAFMLAPIEFYENPFFTEEVLDREESAQEIFLAIKNKFYSEAKEA